MGDILLVRATYNAADDGRDSGMMILKGDKVRLHNGETGEVLDVWGFARTFVRIKKDSDGKSLPVIESEIAEVIRVIQTTKSTKRGKG